MEAFQLRLWDGRIGRWLNPDPYGQYASPYLGMGNNPIGMIDPDGGYTNPISAFFAWAFGGFKGSLEHTGGEGNHKYAIFHEGRVLNDGSGNMLNTVIPDYRQYGKSNSSSSFENLWDNSLVRRGLTGDKIGISYDFDANLFILGGGASIEVNWILTGKDKSFFPYIGGSAHYTASDGFGLSVGPTLSKAFHSGSADDISAESLPGWEYGIEVAAVPGLGVNGGYSYSKDIRPDGRKLGWHQLNIGVKGGADLSPATAANVKVQANYNFVQFHLGSGKFYGNN
jgi:hypothetical protein